MNTYSNSWHALGLRTEHWKHLMYLLLHAYYMTVLCSVSVYSRNLFLWIKHSHFTWQMSFRSQVMLSQEANVSKVLSCICQALRIDKQGQVRTMNFYIPQNLIQGSFILSEDKQTLKTLCHQMILSFLKSPKQRDFFLVSLAKAYLGIIEIKCNTLMWCPTYYSLCWFLFCFKNDRCQRCLRKYIILYLQIANFANET